VQELRRDDRLGVQDVHDRAEAPDRRCFGNPDDQPGGVSTAERHDHADARNGGFGEIGGRDM